jgi:hypothetical protein
MKTNFVTVMIAIVFTAQTIPRFGKILSLIGGSTVINEYYLIID